MPIKLILPLIVFCIYGILLAHATPFIINSQTLDTTNLNVKSYKDKKMQAQIYGVGNLRWQTGALITLGADSILLTISFNSIGLDQTNAIILEFLFSQTGLING